LLVVFSIPLVRRYGQRDTNPSALPRHYGPVVALLIAVIVLIALATIITRRRRGDGGA
jgi:hypothetical protein